TITITITNADEYTHAITNTLTRPGPLFQRASLPAEPAFSQCSSEQSMWHLFHGTDEFSMRESLAALRARGGFGYNQDVFSGAEVTLATLINACETFPFLSEQRLVVLEGLPQKSARTGAASGSGGARKKSAPGKKNANPSVPPGADPKAFISDLAD